LYPSKWLPLYSQVTFSHIRYSDAIANGDRQRKIMDDIMATENIHSNWDEEAVMKKILSLVE
jgi:kynurenine 3-monooxygenase